MRSHLLNTKVLHAALECRARSPSILCAALGYLGRPLRS
jgi:hypothetical protein